MAKKSIPKQYKGKCPYCKKAIITKVKEEIIKPAVAAEKEIKITIEKDSQTKL